MLYCLQITIFTCSSVGTKCRAILRYKPIKITKGMKKNTIIIIMKYSFCQNKSTLVAQAGSPDPESLWYSVIARIGAVKPKARSQATRHVKTALLSVHGSAFDLNGKQIA